MRQIKSPHMLSRTNVISTVCNLRNAKGKENSIPGVQPPLQTKIVGATSILGAAAIPRKINRS